MDVNRRGGLTGVHRWLLTLSCLAVTLVIASMAALYTALPEIAADTGASQVQLTWIVDGYTLALACLVLPAGALGDRYGRRAALIAGLIVFALASALPLLLDSPTWLITARGLAGVGAALVMPSTLSLITASFPPERRNGAIGLWAGVAGVGAILGILGSGILLEYWSWISVFVGMTAAGVVLSIAAFTVPESTDSARPAFDPFGAVTGALAVGAIVVAAIEVPARGWLAPVVLVAAAVAVVSAIAFVMIELRVAYPLLDVRLFADRGFGSGTAIVALQFLVGFGMFMLIVQYFQLIFGYRPLVSALAMAPMMLPMVTISAFAPRLSERIGLRLPAAGGLVLIGIALIALGGVGVDASYVDILWPLLIMSTGIGLCTAPATAAIIAGTPVAKHGVAAAVNDAAREVGAAIGIAVGGSVLAAGYSDRIAPALPRLPEEARGPVEDSLAAALQVAERAGPTGQPLADFAREAFVYGMHHSAVALGCLTLVGAVGIAIWAPGRRRTPEPAAAVPTSERQEQTVAS
ncbi:MFS transporter [Nocardia bovistercoris]|uniref:MFS transporter n=1 Tax=Nocardia bovistercoris TaxID=2785916 RepID=A0A931N5K3_9NOCA|nr:MFS transporter [Nocardia bovistercoris]MBH0779812.1 MFS transporter [Nocardia bovistercoris]